MNKNACSKKNVIPGMPRDPQISKTGVDPRPAYRQAGRPKSRSSGMTSLIIVVLLFASSTTFSAKRLSMQDYYQQAVHDFLEGNNAEALKNLTVVLTANPEHEKAKKLFSQVFARVQHSPLDNKSKKLTGQALRRLRQTSVYTPQVAALKKKLIPKKHPPLKKKKMVPKKATPPAVKPANKPAAATRNKNSKKNVFKTVGNKSRSHQFSGAGGRIKSGKNIFFISMFTLILLLFIATYIIHQNSEYRHLMKKYLAVQADLEKEKCNKSPFQKKDIPMPTGENGAAETGNMQKENENEKIIMGKMDKVKQELENQLREEFQKWEKKFFHHSPGAAPQPATTGQNGYTKGPPTKQILSAPSQTAQSRLLDADNNKEGTILGISVDVPPVDRKNVWGRIAAQSSTLYQDSPETALEFLQELCFSDYHLNRASVVLALEKIGSTETLDLLLGMVEKETHPEVRREVLRSLKTIRRNRMQNFNEQRRKKVADLIKQESNKGEWIL